MPLAPAPSPRPRLPAPAVVFSVALLITCAVTFYVHWTIRARERLRFEGRAAQAAAEIRDRLGTYVALLHAGSGLFAGSSHVRPSEFRAFASRLNLRERYPGIQGVGYSLRFRREALDSLRKVLAADGVTDFRVWPDSTSPELHAIIFLEPLDRRNRAAIGYSMFTHPVRRVAMEAARDLGLAAASGRVTLVQEIEGPKQPGFLIYVPVYRGGTIPPTVAERRERLLGFVYAPFRAGDLFDAIYPREADASMRLRVYDGQAGDPSALLHDSMHDGAANGGDDADSAVHTLDVAGQRWTLVFTRTATGAPAGGEVPLIFVTGVLLSLVLLGVTRAEARAHAQAEAAAIELQRSTQAMLQAQKLESIGVLAGGIAHDFNNLLTGIIGNATLALQSASLDPTTCEFLIDVIRAGERAATLTNQLLAYAGKGRYVVRPVDLCALVRELATLVRASIPRKVTVELDLADDCPLVHGDPAQLQQLVMNLVINGAEAIGDASGKVTVRARGVEVSAEEIAASFATFELTPGRYVRLEVEDTGCGMSERTLAQIFEPFFTTKFTGRGLGLAAALGIVRGHRGAIEIQSAVGQGTTFTVLLPVSERPIPVAPPAPPAPAPRPGLALVADDEEVVRRTAKAVLERQGFKVLIAQRGGEALDLGRAHASQLRLVLLDLTMPELGGDEVAHMLKRSHPELPIVIMSGYGEHEALTRLADAPVANGFLAKPFTDEQLLRAVSQAVGP